jgi:hypothetical protein
VFIKIRKMSLPGTKPFRNLEASFSAQERRYNERKPFSESSDEDEENSSISEAGVPVSRPDDMARIHALTKSLVRERDMILAQWDSVIVAYKTLATQHEALVAECEALKKRPVESDEYAKLKHQYDALVAEQKRPDPALEEKLHRVSLERDAARKEAKEYSNLAQQLQQKKNATETFLASGENTLPPDMVMNMLPAEVTQVMTHNICSGAKLVVASGQEAGGVLRVAIGVTPEQPLCDYRRWAINTK